MKKIIIPFLGLFIFIIITPFVFANLANSKIDEKIKLFPNLQEVKKDIGYINSFREFKVNNCIIDLKFKNLPVTNAIFDIKCPDTKAHIVISNLKNFVFKVNNYTGYYKNKQFYINGQILSKSNVDEHTKKFIKNIGLIIDRIQQKNP
jgi:hypothetical protein